MTRRISSRIIIILVVALMTIGAGTAVFASGMAGGPGFDRSGKRFDRIAAVLGLSDAQRTQIGAIVKAEREKNGPARQQLADIRTQLRQLALADTFDEAAVRAAAAQQARLMTDMTVSRLRVRNQINALLTPEQRALAERLRALRKGGRH